MPSTASPILPYTARVEVFDAGRWVPEAQGSSVEWLRDAFLEAREVYGRVRLAAWWGEVLDAEALLGV